MSEKGHHSKMSRNERLAANLRANLRRRKQASRKAKDAPIKNNDNTGQTPDKPTPWNRLRPRI